jgi:hypothetical protein
MEVKFMCMLFGSFFFFFFLFWYVCACVDLKVKVYEMEVPRGCMVVLYLGCKVEFGVLEGGGWWWCAWWEDNIGL